jgi:hypothetical protein
MIDTLEKTEKYSSWIIEMPSDIAKQEGYAEGSKVILTFQNGNIKPEILPPTTDEIKKEVNRIIGKHNQTFQELKRLGD